MKVNCLYIKSIQMKHYKRFHDLTIDLGETPKRIVALVGPNGCGKSSVFDAMLAKMAGTIGIIGEVYEERGYKYHSLHQQPGYQPSQNIKIMLTGGRWDQVVSEMRKVGKDRSSISFRSPFRYNSMLQIKETKAVEDILENSYGASTASDLDQRMEQNYRRLMGKHNKYRDDNDIKPSEALQHIVGALNQALKKCLDLEIVSLGNVENNEGTLYFKKSDADVVFDYNVLSAGEKEVIDILLDLYIRKDSYQDSIYIFDEPELHLNTAIQRALLVEINRLVPENCQIWLATHSIGFLRALQDELSDDAQIIHFEQGNSWASKEYTLKPSLPSRETWQRIFSTALDDLTTLVAPRVIVYCEGRAEPRPDGTERGLDAMVFNQVFARKYPYVVFVSSGGNTELDQRSDIAIAVLSKVLQQLEIWVLKDRDMTSGNIAGEAERQRYLQLQKLSHRVLKRFEIENYLYDQEVLKKYCDENSLTFDQGRYDASITDIVNDDVKKHTGIIKACCGLKISINAEKFKLALAACIDESMAVFSELEDVIFKRQ